VVYASSKRSRHSTSSLKSDYYEWNRFQAYQAAEKVVKALLHAYGRSACGYSVVELLGYLKNTVEIPSDLYVYARELDRHYIRQGTLMLLNRDTQHSTMTRSQLRELLVHIRE